MTAAARRLLVVGAGGFAREVAWLAETVDSARGGIAVVAFADDNPATHGTTLNGYPVMAMEAAFKAQGPNCFVVAVGSPGARETLAARAAALGLEPLTLVHPGVEMSRFVEIGAGSVICAGCILTTNIRLGAHVQVNLDCTIGHDAVLGDFATLAPGVHVSGQVHLGRGCYLGTGANIINGLAGAPLVVGDGAIVGAGACVIGSVAAGATVVGVPAREKRS